MGVLHRHISRDRNDDWEGVSVERYEDGGVVLGTKRVLIGRRDGAASFSLRYFEIPPGGKSSLDRHAHDHGVYILKGRACVLMGQETVEAGPGDVLYIPPDEPHQFENIGDEPLGFLCAVPPRE
jgi:quercetin dioxygenase-like cupin family protein